MSKGPLCQRPDMPNDTTNRFYAVHNDSSRSSSLSGADALPEPATAPRIPSPLGRASVSRAPTSPTMTPQNGPIQSPGSRSRTSRGSQWWTTHAQDRWTWELVSACVCVALLATVAGILFRYDEKPAPNLPEGITVSAQLIIDPAATDQM